MRETIALEMIGAILCRPSDERQLFARERMNALRCLVARIRGICKVLRGRHFFSSTNGLAQFVTYLEKLFDDVTWTNEVYTVISAGMARADLKSWEAHHVPEREVLKTYSLDYSERKFLERKKNVVGSVHVFPDASMLRGSSLPIPWIR